MSEWLDNLKAGDKVVIDAPSGGMYVSTVERFTKTLIITTGGRFKRSDGSSLGGGWQSVFLREVTTERVSRIRQANLARKFCRYDWKSLPLETLRAVFELLP